MVMMAAKPVTGSKGGNPEAGVGTVSDEGRVEGEGAYVAI